MHDATWSKAVGNPADFAANIAGHAAIGCASTAAQGGSCGSGALAAGFGAAVSPAAAGLGKEYGLVTTTVIGGTASVLGGGKFQNGATTAAFGYLFNQAAHALAAPAVGAGAAAGGLGAAAVGSLSGDVAKTDDYETINRYMARAEYDAMVAADGLLRGGRPGEVYATNDWYLSGDTAQKMLALPVRPELRVTMGVPTGVFSPPTVVQPLFNQPGGGTERIAPGPIRANILDVVPLK